MKKVVVLLLVVVFIGCNSSVFAQGPNTTGLPIPDDIWNETPGMFVQIEGWQLAPSAKINPRLQYELSTCGVQVIMVKENNIELYYIVDPTVEDATLISQSAGEYNVIAVPNWDRVTTIFDIHENGPGIEFEAFNIVGKLGEGIWPHYLDMFPPMCTPQARPTVNIDQTWVSLFDFEYQRESTKFSVSINKGRAVSREEIAGITQNHNDMWMEGFIPLGIQEVFAIDISDSIWVVDYGFMDFNQRPNSVGNETFELPVNHVYWIQEVMTSGDESTTTNVYCIVVRFGESQTIITFTLEVHTHSIDSEQPGA